MIYVAFYKGKAKIAKPSDLLHRVTDGLIRLVTNSPYSHCELVVELGDGLFECYSSSYRDGGVRKKTMPMPDDKWDFVAVNCTLDDIKRHYDDTRGCGYDLIGLLGFVVRGLHDKERYFCSEWCYNAITGNDDGYKYSPADLADIINKVADL